MSLEMYSESRHDPGVSAEKQNASLKEHAADLLSTPENLSGRAASDCLKDQAHANSVYGSISLVAEKSGGARAQEVITSADGQSKEIPLEKLSSGDHRIKLDSGREFIVHVPESLDDKQLPVMFVFAGSSPCRFKIEDFIPEAGLNKFADSPDSKFIAVYPLPLPRLIGVYSKDPAYAWNILDPKGGVLIDREDSMHAGYDDTTLVKDIVNILPEIANVDPTHKDWAAMGFSQGGVFLNYLESNIPHLFPTVDLVGTAMQKDYDYSVKDGNAENVAIVNLRSDRDTLPFMNNINSKYIFDRFLRIVLPKSRVEKIADLAAVHNEDASPEKQLKFYENRLGPRSAEKTSFDTPAAGNQKDRETFFKPLDPASCKQVAVFDLPAAQHAYPQEDPGGQRTNDPPKYTEFNTNRHLVDLWMDYNNKAHCHATSK